MVTTLWIFYVMLSAFYGGAMTMFFTSTAQINLNNIVEVIRAYPDWNLVFLKGNGAKFALKATYDPDYANFWDRALASPADTTFNSIESGLRRVVKDTSVMYIDIIIMDHGIFGG
jgi:hypothetical protein